MSVVISDAWRQRFGGIQRVCMVKKRCNCLADAHICAWSVSVVSVPRRREALAHHFGDWRNHAYRYG